MGQAVFDMTEPLLTDDEHRAVTLAAELAGIMKRIIGGEAGVGSGIAEGDWAEAVHYVHGLQNMVLAQAAARAYPQQYRLMGQRKPPKPDA